MSLRRIAAVAQRVALGFRRDRRSIALLLAAPLVVLSLVGVIWGSNTQTIPNVVVATDRFPLPAPIVDRFVTSTAIHGARATFDEGLKQLREGQADAVVWIEGTTLHLQIDGSDPLRSGSIAPAVQKAFGDAI